MERRSTREAVPSVVVEEMEASVDVNVAETVLPVVLELLVDVGELVLVYEVVVWAVSVVDGQTGHAIVLTVVVLSVGQFVIGLNVGHEVMAVVAVTVGQVAQVSSVGVVHGIALAVVVVSLVVEVKQGGQVGPVVGAVLVDVVIVCASSTARITVSVRLVMSSICIA